MSDQQLFQTKISIAGTTYEFTQCGIAESRELLLDEEGVRGTRSMVLERATQGLIHVGGPIKMQPTPLELQTLWPLIVNSSSANTLSDAMQDITVVKDLITASESYSGRIAKARLEGSPGKRIELTLDFVGYSCTMGSGGVVSGTGDITNSPYMMAGLGSGITIGGTTYNVDRFMFEIDNKIDPTFMQGQTATDLQPTGREVTLGLDFKYTSVEAGLLTTAQAGPVLGSPAVATFALTNGSNHMSISCGAVIAASHTVGATSKKLRLPFEYKCLRVGSTLEIVASFA